MVQQQVDGVGEIEVLVIQGQALLASDPNGFSDPFVQVLSVLQFVAVCGAACCSALPHLFSDRCVHVLSVLQCVAVCVALCVAVFAVCCSAFPDGIFHPFVYVLLCCSAKQGVAVYCSAFPDGVFNSFV